MNAHLELLVSRIFDGDLAPEHREDLSHSGLTDDTIRGALIRSVPPGMIGRLLGFDVAGIRSALLFPFRSPLGGFADLVRLKIFPTLTDRDGHTIKYLQPRGAAPRLYFPPATLRAVLEDDAPLWAVEGEKKALAVAQLGLPAIGVEGWHRGGALRLLADFDPIRLKGRAVELLPDGDYAQNPHVRRAVDGLAQQLVLRGAKPGVRHLPRELPR